MPRAIDREGLRERVTQGAQLVEVLPAAEWAFAHLPGAAHLPLTEFSPQDAHSLLDPTRPIIVYCNDFL